MDPTVGSLEGIFPESKDALPRSADSSFHLLTSPTDTSLSRTPPKPDKGQIYERKNQRIAHELQLCGIPTVASSGQYGWFSAFTNHLTQFHIHRANFVASMNRWETLHRRTSLRRSASTPSKSHYFRDHDEWLSNRGNHTKWSPVLLEHLVASKTMTTNEGFKTLVEPGEKLGVETADIGLPALHSLHLLIKKKVDEKLGAQAKRAKAAANTLAAEREMAAADIRTEGAQHRAGEVPIGERELPVRAGRCWRLYSASQNVAFTPPLPPPTSPPPLYSPAEGAAATAADCAKAATRMVASAPFTASSRLGWVPHLAGSGYGSRADRPTASRSRLACAASGIGTVVAEDQIAVQPQSSGSEPGPEQPVFQHVFSFVRWWLVRRQLMRAYRRANESKLL
ncbi:hypothetical protein FN846DRAFT_893252 [Sphaerosporella brunnea]|uniref:Uncharacterized protein n=1 Tax=Sphaerosporella brunnea TaxID=1250544 RepID=A0A5J5EN62_9PEZI|nr:hypothetical protein FN846DRAFT_893252 [Sphaerosporella brunnea]